MRFSSWLLNEEVYGRMIVGYHRTRLIGNVNSIASGGFRAGSGATYGAGIYLTYDIESQLRPEMVISYGHFIIRSQVMANDFLILNPDVLKTVSGEDVESHIVSKLGKGFLEFLAQNDIKINDPRTSKLAHAAIQYSRELLKKKPFRGLIFTGAADGNVIVSYDPKSIIPLSYTEVGYIDKVDISKLQWTSIKNDAINKQAFRDRIIPDENKTQLRFDLPHPWKVATDNRTRYITGTFPITSSHIGLIDWYKNYVSKNLNYGQVTASSASPSAFVVSINVGSRNRSALSMITRINKSPQLTKLHSVTQKLYKSNSEVTDWAYETRTHDENIFLQATKSFLLDRETVHTINQNFNEFIRRLNASLDFHFLFHIQCKLHGNKFTCQVSGQQPCEEIESLSGAILSFNNTLTSIPGLIEDYNQYVNDTADDELAGIL